jgi:hypothetical protein
MRAFVVEVQTGADAGRESFINKIDPAPAGIVGRVANRTLLNCGC